MASSRRDLEGGRPGVEGAGVVQAQRLDKLDGEAGILGMRLDGLGVRKVPAREDFVHDEFHEPQLGHGDGQPAVGELIFTGLDDGVQHHHAVGRAANGIVNFRSVHSGVGDARFG